MKLLSRPRLSKVRPTNRTERQINESERVSKLPAAFAGGKYKNAEFSYRLHRALFMLWLHVK